MGGGIVLALVFFAAVVCVYWVRRRGHRDVRRMEQLKDVMLEGQQQEIERTRGDVHTLQEAWRIEPADLRLEAFVAAGGEGRVYRGTWRGQFEVAVKMMRRVRGQEEDWGFSNAEVRAMQRLRGSRLVHFYGCGECLLSGNDYRPRLKEVPPGQEVDGWDFLVMVRHDFAEQILCTAFHS